MQGIENRRKEYTSPDTVSTSKAPVISLESRQVCKVINGIDCET